MQQQTIVPYQNKRQYFKLKYKLKSHKHFVQAVAISNNNEILATTGMDCQIGIWKLKSRKKLRNFSDVPFGTHLNFSPSDIYLVASGGIPYSIYIYNLTHIKATNCLVGIINSFRHIITQTIFLNEFQFISSVMDGELRIWNLLTQQEIANKVKVQTSIFDIALTESQGYLFCASDFYYLNILALNRKSEYQIELKQLLDQKLPVRQCSIQLAEKSRLLFTGHYQKIIIWSLNSIMKKQPKALRVLSGDQEFYCVKSFPLQSLIMGSDGKIQVWNYVTAQALQTIDPECRLHYWLGFRFAMTSDTKQLVIGGEDFTVKIYKRF